VTSAAGDGMSSPAGARKSRLSSSMPWKRAAATTPSSRRCAASAVDS
jgi:hypothetical protein